MTDKVYVITDLGPGDGGKGGVVHAVSRKTRAHTILKCGGGQGSHGVCTSNGERFAFSHWGCGTFEGIRTHLTDQMIIIPEKIINEAEALRYGHGLYEVFNLLTVDENALCATPFHSVASRLIEMARGNNPRGTIGTGAGVAYRRFQKTPELAIRAGDLKSSDLKNRLANDRDAVKADLRPIIEGEFLAADREEATKLIQILGDDRFLNHVIERFSQAAKLLQVVAHDYMGEVILAQPGVAIVETSHGVLTDRHYGFQPHTSAIRTLPCFRHGMLEKAGFDGQIVNLGVTRAYAIRHGAGPLPTADHDMAESLLPGSNKDSNRYQGEVRVGPLDFVLLRYAIEVCGGPKAFDGLAVSWFDQIQANGVWQLCQSYEGVDPAYFTSSDVIRVDHGTTSEHDNYQTGLGRALAQCSPQVNAVPVDTSASSDALYELAADTIQASLDVPVRMVSFGPTELDKLFK